MHLHRLAVVKRLFASGLFAGLWEGRGLRLWSGVNRRNERLSGRLFEIEARPRYCIIRGGSFFAARGSNWYVDGGPRPANFATKFLLVWPGLDRCATLGFRCVKDLD